MLLFLQKAWVFMKHNWWLPLGVLAIVLTGALYMSSVSDAIMAAIVRARELHKSDLEAIADAYKRRDAEKAAAEAEYKKKEAAIAAEHDIALKAIEAEKKRREEELKKLPQEDLTKKLGEVAKLDVVEFKDGK